MDAIHSVDRDILTLTLWGEARGEPIESLIGVGNVIRNRATKTSIQAVCLAPHQFSCWTEEKGQLAEASSNLAQGVLTPALRQCQFIADGLMSGALLDNTKGATHYYATSIPAPKWAVGPPLAHLGHHLFFHVS